MSKCKYCVNTGEIENTMLEVCRMRSGTLYLLKDQTLPGRCIFAFNRHIRRITELQDWEYRDFFDDIFQIAKALESLFLPDKINYLVLGDLSDHLHMHIVPKYRKSPDWGKVFELDRAAPILLTDNEYEELTYKIKIKLKMPESDKDKGAACERL